ncbi:hypothetical protein [Macrococcoides caseolyticum]|uniref:hypothetical protein n=1 Tax=Macrococcoides caseolyticum TaxID=69966 RepID=UPI000C340D6D|nr:hypothetical protein [Macrococcus caseolyticus]PKE20731.1 hypothetical protein CW688_11000 [Macrococcus caseolyticus]PKE71378.1 hypothetical protein CW665_10825 [Macrococcus caseolyticus]PKF05331.1 hypothetical protein CW698_10565 [Macrococcus caseolyticus]
MSVDYVTTKKASELLKVSASSLRSYAQTMESFGYTFKKIDNARQFNEFDLQLIVEALTRFQSVGGTVKESLQYVIIKDKEGVDSAEQLSAEPEPTNNTMDLSVITEVQKNIVDTVTGSVNSSIDSGIERLLNAINGQDTTKEDLKRLESESQKALNEVQALKQENEKLRKELDQIKSMNYWQFRKWKK